MLRRSLSLLLLICGGILLLYERSARLIPSRLNPLYAPKIPFGLRIVANFSTEADSYGSDLIFVHGLGSNPDTTWLAPLADRCWTRSTDLSDQPPLPECPANIQGLHDRPNVNWVTDLLPDDLPNFLRRETRAYFYNYDSYWKRDASRATLDDHAARLLQEIQVKLRNSGETRNRPIIFVAHSFGGLVVKQALVRAHQSADTVNLLRRTRSVIFLGTPHRGSTFSEIGRFQARLLGLIGSNTEILASLEFDSEYLAMLHEFFVEVSKKIDVVNFYEHQRHACRLGSIRLFDSYIVEPRSAKYFANGVKNIHLDVDHSGLNKFGYRSASYELIKQHILAALEPSVGDLYSVPIARVEYFVSRPDLEQDLEKTLILYIPTAVHPLKAYLHGLGGVGKTQLVLDFISQRKHLYQAIFWIDARTRSTLFSSLERWIETTKIPLSDKKAAFFEDDSTELGQHVLVTQVRHWFERRIELGEEWLLVMDNVDSEWLNIEDILPNSGRGHIIVIGQHSPSRYLQQSGFAAIEVTMMTQTESQDLMTKRLHIHPEHISSNERQAMNELTEKLDYFPLALNLAAAYIFEHSGSGDDDDDLTRSIMQYLRDFENHKEDVLRTRNFDHASSYDKTVWTVWDTTLTAIQRRYPDGESGLLLAMLACLDGANIQSNLFAVANTEATGVVEAMHPYRPPEMAGLERWLVSSRGDWDSYYLRADLEPLIRYGLLHSVAGTWPGFTMHGLIQARARALFPERNVTSMASLFVATVAFAANHQRIDLEFRRSLIPHLQAIFELLVPKDRGTSVSVISGPSTNLFVQVTIAQALYYEGHWKAAEALLSPLIEFAKRNSESSEPIDWSDGEGMVAVVLLTQKRFEEAESFLLRLLELKEQNLVPDQSSTLATVRILIKMYASMGQLEKAEALASRLLDISAQPLALGDERVVEIQIDLARIYTAQNRLQEAQTLHEKSLISLKELPRPEQSYWTCSFGDLALIYQSQGRLKEAEEIQLSLLENAKSHFGPENPVVLAEMHGLAVTYFKQERYADAAALLSHIVHVSQERYRYDGFESSDSRFYLAFSMDALGQPEECMAILRETVDLAVERYGQASPKTQQATGRLEDYIQHCNQLWGYHCVIFHNYYLIRYGRIILRSLWVIDGIAAVLMLHRMRRIIQNR